MPFLNAHLENCSPLLPCINCKCVAFLRSKLLPADFSDLLTLFDVGDSCSSTKIGTAITPVPFNSILESLPNYQDLTARMKECMRNMNIETVGDLILSDTTDLQGITGLGAVSLRTLEEFVLSIGYQLDVPPTE